MRLHQRSADGRRGLSQVSPSASASIGRPPATRAANEAVRHRVSEDDLVIGVVGTNAEVGEALTKAVPHLAKAEVVPFDLE